MTRAQWIRRQLITYGVFLLAVNNTAGWARFLLGDEMREPWVFSLARPFMAAMFLWWGVTRLIEDINIHVIDKQRKADR